MLLCQWWASPDVKLPPDPEDPTSSKDPKLLQDAPRFGVAFHAVMERHAKRIKFDIKKIATDHDVDDRKLLDYYERAKDFLRDYLRKKEWIKLPLHVEQKLAYDPFRDAGRFLAAKGTRDYSDKKPTELPGTLDLAAKISDGQFFTADWKTGNSFYEADDNKQLDSLSLGLSRIWDMRDGTSVNAIFRIDDEFIELSETVVGPKRWARHQKKLRLALIETYSKTPAMRQGIHCKWCPANEVCPAVVGPGAMDDLVAEAMDSETIRRVYEATSPLEKALDKRRKRIMTWVENNGPFELSNGKVLKIIETSQDNLSKASIERALGKVAGMELIHDLRSRGCIEKLDKKQLREVKP